MLRISTTMGCVMIAFSRSRSGPWNWTHSVDGDQRIGALRAGIGILAKGDFRHLGPWLAPCRRDLTRAPRRACRPAGWHVAHVGSGLKVRPSTAMVLPRSEHAERL